MTLFEALMKAARTCAMLALAQGSPAFAATSPASDPESVNTTGANWSSSSSSSLSEGETAVNDALRELRCASDLLRGLELHLNAEGVRTYLRTLDRILDIPNESPEQLVGRAGAMAIQLAAARTSLMHHTTSSGVWLTVAKATAPDAGPYPIPGRLVLRASVGPVSISVDELEDTLLAQDALSFATA